jgi:glutathione S-transferase
VEYILERYGDARLAPPPGSPERGAFLQWLHFAESTAFPPLVILVWLTLYRDDAEQHPEIIEDAKARAAMGLDFLERELEQRPYLVGPALNGYVARLEPRPAFQKAIAVG